MVVPCVTVKRHVGLRDSAPKGRRPETPSRAERGERSTWRRLKPPKTTPRSRRIEPKSFLCVALCQLKNCVEQRYVVVRSYAYSRLHVRQKSKPVHPQVDAAGGRDPRSDLSLCQLPPRDETYHLGIGCVRRRRSLTVRRAPRFGSMPLSEFSARDPHCRTRRPDKNNHLLSSN
jgi:hypothetical protein